MWLMIALPKNSWTYFKFVLFWVSWDPSWWYSQFNSPPALCCVYITLWVGGYISRLLYFFPLLLVLEPCLVWCVWQSEKTCLLTNSSDPHRSPQVVYILPPLNFGQFASCGKTTSPPSLGITGCRWIYLYFNVFFASSCISSLFSVFSVVLWEMCLGNAGQWLEDNKGLNVWHSACTSWWYKWGRTGVEGLWVLSEHSQPPQGLGSFFFFWAK